MSDQVGGSVRRFRFHDFKFGFLRIPSIVAATAVLVSVVVIWVGEASTDYDVRLNLRWGIEWAIGFLAGFGLCAMAEDANPTGPRAARKPLWPRLGDYAAVISLAATYLVLLARSLWKFEDIGSAMISAAAVMVGVVAYVVGWLFIVRGDSST